MNNSYSTREYEKICDEFGVPHSTGWRVAAVNNGLGEVYYHPTHYTHLTPIDSGGHWRDAMSFKNIKGFFIVNYLEQDFDGADKAWRTFIIAKSKGFTTPGVTRLNDSIRAYMWAIVSSQLQTRSRIVGTRNALEAQKQFLSNVENAISADDSVHRDISRYQRFLETLGCVIDFSFGEGLYMAPSDMLLSVGVIVGYNNKIVTATDAQKLGLNSGLNKSEAPQDAANDTGEEGLVKPDRGPRTTQPPAPKSRPSRVGNTDHEDEKTALIVIGVATGLLTLWLIW